MQEEPIVDVIILTALAEEYDAVCSLIINLSPLPSDNSTPNPATWQLGEIQCTKFNRAYRVAVGMVGLGGPDQALATLGAIRKWKARYIFSVGIAGGVSQLKLGDVIIADLIHWYEWGKFGGGFKLRDSLTYITDIGLLNLANSYALKSDWLRKIDISPPNNIMPNAVIGEIASGSKVVDLYSDVLFRDIFNKWPNVKAVDMVGVGIANAIEQAKSPGFPVGFMMVRGISDLLHQQDFIKNKSMVKLDSGKSYAARTAAAFAIGLISNGLPFPPNRGESHLAEKDNLSRQLVGPSTHITADIWTLDDVLGFRAYAYAIYRFMTNPETKSPLTISIQAPWGGGKTSMMKMIRAYIDPAAEMKPATKSSPQRDARQMEEMAKNTKIGQHTSDHDILTLGGVEKEVEYLVKNPEKPKPLPLDNYDFIEGTPDEPCIPTVWFNAWKYQSTNQVWAGLADAIISQVAERLPAGDRERFWLQLNIKRIDCNKVRNQIYDSTLTYILKDIFPKLKYCGYLLAIPIAFTLYGWLSKMDFWMDIGWLSTSIPAIVGAAYFFIKIPSANKDAKSEAASTRLSEYMQLPDYRSELGFIHQVVSDLKRIFASLPNQRMVVFIDDLDRCSPKKISEVMEGINLFLGGDFLDCMFVIGMDAEMVAAALDSSHADVIKCLPEGSCTPVGWRFMDKFVQLPFVIPTPEGIDLDRYIAALLSNSKRISGSDDELLSQLIAEFKEKRTANEDLNNEIIAIKEKHNLTDDEFKELNAKIECQIIRDKQDLDFEKFNDDNEEICDLIRSAAGDFSNNPRELKRFINAFRLQYFLYCTKIEQASVRGIQIKVDFDQVKRWVVLSMKWPEVIRWIQHNGGRDRRANLNEKDSNCLSRLKQLELMGKESTNMGIWLSKAREIVQLNIETTPWLKDDALRQFFYDEFNNYSEGHRLSDGSGKGLW